MKKLIIIILVFSSCSYKIEKGLKVYHLPNSTSIVGYYDSLLVCEKDSCYYIK